MHSIGHGSMQGTAVEMTDAGVGILTELVVTV